MVATCGASRVLLGDHAPTEPGKRISNASAKRSTLAKRSAQDCAQVHASNILECLEGEDVFDVVIVNAHAHLQQVDHIDIPVVWVTHK